MTKVTVATIEGVPIFLDEISISPPYVGSISSSIFLGGVFCGLYAFACLIARDYLESMICFSLAGAGIFFGATFYGGSDTPGYAVSLEKTNGLLKDIRRIPKTTPEQDQIAICKAVNEFKAQIRADRDKQNELEMIARKCK
jgi:hypothetical protein